MSIGTIKSVIMERDGISSEEADELISEAREQLQEYASNGDTEMAYEICEEYFGLEPDYIMELM